MSRGWVFKGEQMEVLGEETIRELLILDILLSKKCKNELQSSEEGATMPTGGLKRLDTIENR